MSRDINCSRFQEDMTAYVQGELSPEIRATIEEHMAGCAACRREFEDTKQLLSLAPELPSISATSQFHQRMMEAVRVEREVIRMSASERMKMAVGYVGYKFQLSRKARVLAYAMAAQVALLLTVVFGFNLIVQKTDAPRPQMVVEPLEEESQLDSSHEGLQYPRNSTGKKASQTRVFDPPEPITNDLSMPLVASDFATVEKRFSDPDKAYPLDLMNRVVERENRMELSRFHMESRFPWKDKDRVREGRGGDWRTARAVDRGLGWLSDNQGSYGAWSPKDPSDGDPRAVWGVTALATAAFLSDGHTREDGQYAETVRKGLDFLLQEMDPEGRIGYIETDARISIFNQSTAVFALAEHFILCKGAHERELLLATQALCGQLLERNASIETLTHDALCDTWAAMALNTVMMTGLDTQGLEEATRVATDRVARKARMEGWASLLPLSMRSTPPLYAATGLAMNALFHDLNPDLDSSWIPLPDQDALERLFSLLDTPAYREPSFLFFFGTALCEQDDPLWKDWNRRIKIDLIRGQEKQGLWAADSVSPWVGGGDVYFTALHLLTLQIYYRFSNH